MDGNKPVNEVEIQIAEIWKSVFDVEEVGRHDNFFDLGGHSLNAIQVVTRLQDAFRIEITVRTVFDHPTVAELGERVVEALMQASSGHSRA